MKALLKWNEGMKFTAAAGDHSIHMDAKSPIGSGTALTPKELVVAGLGGCTAMDVVAWLKKKKQNLESLEIEAQVEVSQGTYPVVFTSAILTFMVQGSVNPSVLLEAVELSQSKYCGVSAMLAKAFPISYEVVLNGEKIGSGKAHFES